VLQPVPMPSAPFTSTMGSTGMYLRARAARDEQPADAHLPAGRAAH